MDMGTKANNAVFIWILGIVGSLISAGIIGNFAILFSMNGTMAAMVADISALKNTSQQYVTVDYMKSRAEVNEARFREIGAKVDSMGLRVGNMEQKISP